MISIKIVSACCLIVALQIMCNAEETVIGFMGFSAGHSPIVQLGKIGAGLSVAVDTINANNTILENEKVSYTMLDTMCNEKLSLSGFVTMVKERNISVLIGPACGAEVEAVGFLASEWKVPMISYTSVTESLENKAIYDTLLIAGGNWKQTGDAIRKVVASTDAENICLHMPFQKGHLGFIQEGFDTETYTENITIKETFLYDYRSEDPEKHNDVLQQIKKQCRGKNTLRCNN